MTISNSVINAIFRRHDASTKPTATVACVQAERKGISLRVGEVFLPARGQFGGPRSYAARQRPDTDGYDRHISGREFKVALPH